MKCLDGDTLGLVLEYTTLHEAVRLLLGVFGQPLSYTKLCHVLSKRARQLLLQQISRLLLFSASKSTRRVGLLELSEWNGVRIWSVGSLAILRKCSICFATVQWKDPGWTTDASMLCWRHYQQTHQRHIATSKELADLCCTTSVPKAVKRKYEELHMRRKKTAIGAYLYYIEPIQTFIMDYADKRRLALREPTLRHLSASSLQNAQPTEPFA